MQKHSAAKRNGVPRLKFDPVAFLDAIKNPLQSHNVEDARRLEVFVLEALYMKFSRIRECTCSKAVGYCGALAVACTWDG